jgi:anaerobic selenocysteine-containing dehydrogenase
MEIVQTACELSPWGYGTIHGIPYVTLRKKVIDFPEAWPDLKFWFELAKRMGYEAYFSWKDVDEAIAYALKPSGLTLQQLMDHPQSLPFGTVPYDQYTEKGFSTPSKKIEIYSETLKGLGHDPLPAYRESPLAEGNLAMNYPLHLTTGARTLEYLHSEMRNIRRLHKKSPEP